MAAHGDMFSGFGPTPERVLADVRAGYVSLAAAERDYGVCVHQGGAHGRDFTLDVEATLALRERLAAAVVGQVVT